MIKCTTVGVEPSNMCYEICVMAKRCGALKAWVREHKNGYIEQMEKERRVMFETIPKREVSKIICKHCLNVNKYCQHYWDCPLLTEIMKFTDHETENSSEKSNKSKIPTDSGPQRDCKGCKFESGAFCTVDGDCKYFDRYEPKDEP